MIVDKVQGLQSSGMSLKKMCVSVETNAKTQIEKMKKKMRKKKRGHLEGTNIYQREYTTVTNRHGERLDFV